MISYSTQFPVNQLLTKDEFIKSVVLWNQGSRFDKFENISWDGKTYSFTVQEQEKTLAFEDLHEANVIASRLTKTDEHGIWKTDFVLNCERRLLSVKVTHETTEFTTDFSPSYYPPFFVKMMIRDGYAGYDGGLVVSKDSMVLSDSNTELVSTVINHSAKLIMPVVLVSRSTDGKLPIDIAALAMQLQGVAHVIDEGDTFAVSKMKINDEIVKPGQIFVVFSNENARTKAFNLSGDVAENPEIIHSRIVNEVYNYCNHAMRQELDTWEGIQNEKLRIAQSRIKEENAELYQMFGEELSKYEELNSSLTRENQRLLAENQMLRLKLAARDQVPLLFMGEERDFYAGEIREIILDILSDYKKNGQGQCRRADIILDLIENNEFDEIPSKRRELVKNILKGYKTMSGSLRGQLEELGFQITDDGKHYKWTYYGDDRYMVTAAKTSSDNRAGNNLASEINKLML